MHFAEMVFQEKNDGSVAHAEHKTSKFHGSKERAEKASDPICQNQASSTFQQWKPLKDEASLMPAFTEALFIVILSSVCHVLLFLSRSIYGTLFLMSNSIL